MLSSGLNITATTKDTNELATNRSLSENMNSLLFVSVGKPFSRETESRPIIIELFHSRLSNSVSNIGAR